MAQSERWGHLRGDIYGGVTAAVVALPLALAFGVSSGVGPVAGLYGAICVGLFAALFGGTPSQVSGPTGPMTVVMAAVFTDFVARDPANGPVLAFTVVMLAGGFQILFGLLRLGKYITLVPFPVISGFMTGIGVIIILLQLEPLLGHPAEASVLSALQELPAAIVALNVHALGLALLTLAILFFWPSTFNRWLPAPLAALILGTALTVSLYPQGAVAVIGSIPQGLPALHWPHVDMSLAGEMIRAALMLAALGAIDSLLTSLVADNLTKSQHNPNRELVGQGIGNLAAGLFGGLPGAGATMRTVVNIRAGGRTGLSGAVHALLLLLAVLGGGQLAEAIPHAVLAGILLKVGLDIIDWRFLGRVHRAPPFVAGLMFLVLYLTVFVDLVTAVGVGVFLANLYTVRRLSDLQLESARVVGDDEACLTPQEREILAQSRGRILLYQLTGPVSFGAAKAIQKKIAAQTAHDALVLDLSAVPYIDVSTAIAVEELILESRQGRREVYLVGMAEGVADVMARMGVLKRLGEDRVYPQRIPALLRAQALLGEEPLLASAAAR
ncbi:SulP family inorganic anion transporter [Motiliproteus sp. SC1-56]|uniref:SulP family inorganic anion transporter n=1 Tax=Motiliproteus sp. SC1-56 TaxID=2799565 RepID=UPI001A8EB298